jgi:hypothetical protein
MAFWKRRRDSQVTVYYWDRATKKQVAAPRSETAHLDDMSDQEINAWVAEFEEQIVPRLRSRSRAVQATDRLSVLIDAFLQEHAALRETKDKTRQDLGHHLRHFATEYFVRVHAEKDVRKWWKHTPGFPLWLRTSHPNMTLPTVKKIIQSLRRFGEYLATHHVIPQPWLLPLPRARQRPHTPLIKAQAPAAVLAAPRRDLCPDAGRLHHRGARQD